MIAFANCGLIDINADLPTGFPIVPPVYGRLSKLVRHRGKRCVVAS